jgi:hypothetical protein
MSRVLLLLLPMCLASIGFLVVTVVIDNVLPRLQQQQLYCRPLPLIGRLHFLSNHCGSYRKPAIHNPFSDTSLTPFLVPFPNCLVGAVFRRHISIHLEQPLITTYNMPSFVVIVLSSALGLSVLYYDGGVRDGLMKSHCLYVSS